jgi:predicted MFS family arabinose efflux permease
MSERRLIFLLGAVQFINIVDFMLVIPLGPDFARALQIPNSRLGLVAGSYTAAAAIAGLVAAQFLDRFDRRRALFVAMIGLVTGTAAAGLATGLGTMLLARVLAGAFGGPATSVSLSILTDAVPPERRGKALGAVMGAFSAASVLGVPAGLELARLGGWKTPFFVVAALGFCVATAAVSAMPPMRGHLQSLGGRRPAARPFSELIIDPTVLLSLAATAAVMTGSFAIIVNLSAFVQFNMHFPRQWLGHLYAAGGLISFFTMRLAGAFVDRRGSVPVATVASALVAAVIAAAFLPECPLIPALVIYVGFMIANSGRMVALNALTTRVPAANERARFMSSQSAVQHLSTALGAISSTALLTERPDHSLAGMPVLALGAIALCFIFPALLAAIDARLRARAEAEPAVAVAPAAE